MCLGINTVWQAVQELMQTNKMNAKRTTVMELPDTRIISNKAYKNFSKTFILCSYRVRVRNIHFCQSSGEMIGECCQGYSGFGVKPASAPFKMKHVPMASQDL